MKIGILGEVDEIPGNWSYEELYNGEIYARSKSLAVWPDSEVVVRCSFLGCCVQSGMPFSVYKYLDIPSFALPATDKWNGGRDLLIYLGAHAPFTCDDYRQIICTGSTWFVIPGGSLTGPELANAIEADPVRFSSSYDQIISRYARSLVG